jgi:hypothetical protein
MITPMLFLLNDHVLDFESEDFLPPFGSERFHALSLAFVTKLGQEIYAESPLLHREEPERAKRLALLIASKAPDVNAALFVAPAKGCRPDQVTIRLTKVDEDTLSDLHEQDMTGALTPVKADREVWRRLAA